MTRKFRDSWQILLVGGFLLAIGLVIASQPLYHILTGIPLMIRNSKTSQLSHEATLGELAFLFFVPMILAVLGGFLVTSWIYTIIETSDSGIVRFGSFGKVSFQCSWSEISSVKLERGTRGLRTYVVITNLDRLSIPSSETNIDELLGIIRIHSDHVNFSDWDS